MAGMVREIGPDELLTSCPQPFVRHQVDPARTRRAWRHGDAVVVDGVRGRPGERPRGPVYTCLGPPADLEPLMAYVDRVGPAPWRVSVEAPAAAPRAWDRPEAHTWHWMLTHGPVPPRGPHPVTEVREAREVDAVLDVANPDSFARPGGADLVAWLGVRRSRRLVAVGALAAMHDGTLHLRGVSVLPEARGDGVGRSLSAALTAHALHHGSGVATLGVYTDNEPALRIYRSLGYEVVHTFCSGEVAARSRTTAAEPSR
jgi:ribosomal protein S18 acetylase RimI-like enzyme